MHDGSSLPTGEVRLASIRRRAKISSLRSARTRRSAGHGRRMRSASVRRLDLTRAIEPPTPPASRRVMVRQRLASHRRCPRNPIRRSPGVRRGSLPGSGWEAGVVCREAGVVRELAQAAQPTHQVLVLPEPLPPGRAMLPQVRGAQVLPGGPASRMWPPILAATPLALARPAAVKLADARGAAVCCQPAFPPNSRCRRGRGTAAGVAAARLSYSSRRRHSPRA
jgi:hypothetical protein